MPILRRVAAFTGYGGLAATGGWLWYSRRSHLSPLSPDDYLFHSTQFARLNPNGHPSFSDICVREVPLSQLKSDDLKENGRLVEKFCAGTFGGIGFAVQRALLERSNYNAQTAHHLWKQADLASSKYETGTEMVDHFEIISKTDDSIIVRCGGSPLNKDVRAGDGLFELTARTDEQNQVARFEMKSIFFSGLNKSEHHLVPSHIVWGHRLYTKLWMETGVRHLTS